jgi:hypothetical protein
MANNNGSGGVTTNGGKSKGGRVPWVTIVVVVTLVVIAAVFIFRNIKSISSDIFPNSSAAAVNVVPQEAVASSSSSSSSDEHPYSSLPCSPSPTASPSPDPHSLSFQTDSGGNCTLISKCTGNYTVSADGKSCVPPPPVDCSQAFQQSPADVCLNHTEAGFKWSIVPSMKTCMDQVDYYIANVYSSKQTDAIYQIKLDKSFSGRPGALNSVGIKNLWGRWYDNQNMNFALTPYDKNGKQMADPIQVPANWGDNNASCSSKGITTYEPKYWNDNKNLIKVTMRNTGALGISASSMSGWTTSDAEIYPYPRSAPGETGFFNGDKIDSEKHILEYVDPFLAFGSTAGTYVPKGGTIIPRCAFPLAGIQNWDAKPSFSYMMEKGAASNNYTFTVENSCVGSGAQDPYANYHAGG